MISLHSQFSTMRAIYVSCFILGVQVLAQDSTVVVKTPKGVIRGQDVGEYKTFFGVPYAKVDEEKPFGTTKTNLPVLVWFHGGGFYFGSAGDYGGQYLVRHDIIVVAANYRLGPYGFFCLDDPEVPGNQGLKDQVTALRWVKENIAAFGGDPAKVTIAGESYGGGSVELHIFANSEKLFDKAIIQSGGAEVEALFVKPDSDAAVKLAKLFNHTASNNKNALKYLAQKDPIELMTAFKSSGILLRACKEKKFRGVQSFLTEDPFHLYKPKRVENTPVLFGYNSKETFDMVANKSDEFFESKKDLILEKLNSTFNLKKKDLQRLAGIVQKFYLGSKEVSKESFLELGDFLGDFIMNHATEASVTRLVDQGAKVYKYLFSYIGNSPFKNIPGAGAIHTEELQYLFQFGKELKESENLMVRDRMTTMWANFVKYGNPTPEITDLLPVQWEHVPKDSRPYLNIDLKMEMLEDVYHDRVAFWDLIWEIYGRNSRVISRR